MLFIFRKETHFHELIKQSFIKKERIKTMFFCFQFSGKNAAFIQSYNCRSINEEYHQDNKIHSICKYMPLSTTVT